jgi:hypothetical protein
VRAALILFLSGTALAAEYTYVPAGDFGRRSCAANGNWRAGDFDDRAWLDNNPDAGAGCTPITYARWRFDAGPELAKLQTLTLRARYEHGFAAYLNGVEIARRRLDSSSELASETHGPEWDRLSLPLKPGMLRQKGNVLAIEVHARTPGRAPFLDVELAAADGPRIVRGPYLSRLSEREVTVIFDSDLPTLGEIRWGTSESYGQVLTDGLGQHHILKLKGLEASTSYHYRVLCRTQAAPIASNKIQLGATEIVDAGDAQFHTPPVPGKVLRFVVYGDVRSGHDIHAQLARSIAEEDPDLALVTGDLVDRGTDEGDWEKFFDVGGQLLRQLTIFPAAGNHEYARLGRGVGNFLSLFREGDDIPYYSFDVAGAHFVALDSNQYNSPRQLAWLEKDLSATRSKAIFVFAHEGPWSTGLHGDNPTCIRDYVPVLERHHVSMFFYGHDHHYERGRVGKLDYLVTGGGGAELRPPKCIPGKKCPPRVLEYLNDHNYVTIEVLPSLFRLCPKHPDGTAIFPCSSFPLRK